METYKRTGAKLTTEERETVIVFDYFNKTWIMDSAIPKHFNKALKQGWEPIAQWVYDDNSVFAMKLQAPEHAITIRNTAKKVMSDKQMQNLSGCIDEDDE